MTAPVYSQTGTNTQFAGVGSVNVALPATVADGEVAIMVVSCALSTTGTITWPAGWTEIGQGTQGGVDQYSGCAWKRLSASDGGTSPTVNFAANQNGAARVATFLQCKSSGTPYEGLAANQGTSASCDGSSLVTTGPDRLGVIVNTFARNVVTSPPSGWTEQIDSGGNGARITVDTKALPSAGTEAAGSTTITSDDWRTWTLALVPEPSRSIVL